MKKKLNKILSDFEECLDNGQNVITLDCGNREKIINDIIELHKNDTIEFLEYVQKSNDSHNEIEASEFVKGWIKYKENENKNKQ